MLPFKSKSQDDSRLSHFSFPQMIRNFWRLHSTKITILNRDFVADSMTNVGPSIVSKLDRKLHLQPNHPLNILKTKIEAYFHGINPGYCVLDSMNPIVTTKQNFDDLLFTPQHPGRSKTDTYYIDNKHVLRTHTSAHQSEAIASKRSNQYLLTADVYRRDEIDPTHYPVFHQMEGIRLFSTQSLETELNIERFNDSKEIPIPKPSNDNPYQQVHDPRHVELVGQHLRKSLEGLMRYLFHQDLQIRWIDGYFPFTSPSWEMEVYYNNQWLELCGCGVIEQDILNEFGAQDKIGWAFGLGLERIAMVLFDIPDIRLFWSQDQRFLSQFQNGKITKFVPFSKYPVCYKDVSFWMKEEFHDNDFAEIVRQFAGDLVEQVKLIDEFKNKKGRVSRCYRIEYRSMERTLTNEEVDAIQERIRDQVVSHFGVELR
ncbi:phenylalanyl-tRNA synthetase [Gorgonomyces haynaldii]|nr:phenylalanyl-tRNA synthetase [Gorgonomyces haynaldii]